MKPPWRPLAFQINITRNGKSIMDLICLLDSTTPCLLRLTVKITFSPEIWNHFFSLNLPKLCLLKRVFDHQITKLLPKFFNVRQKWTGTKSPVPDVGGHGQWESGHLFLILVRRTDGKRTAFNLKSGQNPDKAQTNTGHGQRYLPTSVRYHVHRTLTQSNNPSNTFKS